MQTSCAVSGCKNGSYAKGLCALHYNRKKRTGSTDGPLCKICKQQEVVGQYRICEACRTTRPVEAITTHKVCTRCFRNQPINRFARAWKSKGVPKGFDGRKAVCKDCDNAAIREDRARNPHKYRRWDNSKREGYSATAKRAKHLKYSYQMTTEEYDQKVIQQEGLCAICKTHVDRLYVDHDHQCCPAGGKSCGQCVRGLLCSRCNLALGNFNDDLSLLEEAIAYVESYRAVERDSYG